MIISVGEYLKTFYSPDREYVDGQLLERNVGEWDHSWLQRGILLYSAKHWESLGFLAMPELRVQVKPSRYRVPDVAVIQGNPNQQILTKPPFICIEILSPDDSLISMEEKIADYLSFGVPNIWVIDPRRNKAFWSDSAGIHETEDTLLTSINKSLSLDLTLLWPVA